MPRSSGSLPKGTRASSTKRVRRYQFATYAAALPIESVSSDLPAARP
jgi:hypothetical protein